MKILRVRIIDGVYKTGSSERGVWYADKIGQEFHVVEDFCPRNYPFWYRVIPVGTHDHDSEPAKRYISIGDFEVIEEYGGEVVTRIVVSIERS